MWKFISCLFLFVLIPNAQEPTNNKDINKIKGVEITYLPNGSELEKQFRQAGLKEGDLVISYAGILTPQEKYLMGVDTLLVQLEKEWIKEGKPKDFWEKKADWIKKRTRGVSLKPIAFSEKKPLYPLYSVKYWRKQSQKELTLKSGLFSFYVQERNKRKQAAFELFNKGVEAEQKRLFTEALSHFQKAYQIFSQFKDFQNAAANLNRIAGVYESQGKLELALQFYMKAYKLFKQLGSSSNYQVALNLAAAGKIYHQQGKMELALKTLKESYQIFEQLGNSKYIRIVLSNIGGIYSDQGQLDLALKTFNRHLELSKQIGKLDNIAFSLNNIAGVYEKQGKFKLALEMYQKSYQLFKQFGNPSDIARTLGNLGGVYQEQKDFETALEVYIEVYQLYKQLENPRDIAIALGCIASIYQEQRQYELALDTYKETLKLSKQTGNPVDISIALNNLGGAYSQQGKLDLALTYFKKSLELRKQIGNPKDIAGVLNNIGGVYETQGKFKLALETYQECYQLSVQFGNPRGIATSLSHLGELYRKAGKLELALKKYKESYILNQKIGNPKDLAGDLNNIGIIYADQGKLENALEHYQKSHQINLEGGNPAFLITSFNNIGYILDRQGKEEQALKAFENALKLSKQTKNEKDVASSFNNIAHILDKQGQLEQALKLYQESYRIFNEAGDLEKKAILLGNIGMVCNSQGKLDLALQYNQESYQIFKQLEQPENLAMVCLRLGKIYWNLKDPRASEFFIKGVNKLKIIANEAGSGRETFFKQNLHDYAHIIEMLHFQEPEHAFEILQQCKAFGFLTQLSELSLSLENSADSKLVQEKKSLIAQISSLYKQIKEINETKKNLKHFSTEERKKLNALKIQLKEVIQDIREGNPAYSSIEYPEPVKLREIQKRLKEEDLFLEYFCAPKEHGFQGNTYCFIIGKTEFEVVKLKETDVFNEEINYFRELLWESTEKEELEEYQEEAINLYKGLLKPVFDKIENSKLKIKHLIIAPDGILNLLPFEVLCFKETKNPQTYEELCFLLDQFKISYNMSATVYEYMHKQHLESTALKAGLKDLQFFGVGDPLFRKNEKRKLKFNTRAGLAPLPGTRKELTEIAKLFEEGKRRILLGEEAIEPVFFLEDLSSFDIIHIATHGIIDIKNPMYSSLALTLLTETQQEQFDDAFKKKNLQPENHSDGFLRVQDIFQLHGKLNAELVVLSACETGTGKIVRGDGIVGLTRAFQFAGTPSIVVSLWEVADDSTSLLMQYFYQELLKETNYFSTENKLKSLHESKVKLRHSEKYCAPYYWGAFILRGLP